MSNRQFFKRRSIIFLLLGILIGSIPSALFVAAQSGTPTTFTISAGQSPGAPDWTVYVDGGYYWAKNKYGTLQSSTGNTNASYVINTVLASLTSGRDYQETVLLHGNFTVTNSLVIYSWTHLILEGTITLQSGSNCDLLRNANQATNDYNVIIEGGIWDPNSAGQTTTGNGIEFICGTTAPYPWTPIVLKDFVLYLAKENGVHIELQSQPVWIENVDAFGSKHGAYIWGATDCLVNHCHFGSDNPGTYFAVYFYGGGGMSTWTDIRTDSGIKLQSTQQLVLDGFTIDLYNHDVDGLILEDSHHNQFANGLIRQELGGASTTSAIKLVSSGWCDYNSFSNINTGDMNAGGNPWKYGVEENTSGGQNPNYNLYTTINAYHTATTGLLLTGANSKVANCWNQTSWINHS